MVSDRLAETARDLQAANVRIFEMIREIDRRDELIFDLERRIAFLEKQLQDLSNSDGG